MDVKPTQVNSNVSSIYACVFDESSRSWNKTKEYNLFFLQTIQNHMNDCLHSRGHVFLNEVYDELDLKRTSIGSITGWFCGGDSDSFIKFSIEDADNGSFMLDFNVDGIIYDKI